MARQRQAPPPARSEGPSLAAAPVGGIIAGTPSAAAGAAGLAAGAQVQQEIAANTIRAVLGMLAAIALRRRKLIADRTLIAYPNADLAAALAEEDRREIVFRKRVEQRLRAGMKIALAAKDPSARAAAIQALMKREQRFAEMRSEASAERVLAAAELADLRTRSPQGAFWALGMRQKHTPDCIAMAGKFWPWEVLNEVHPLLHVGCGCRLFSFGEAVSQGMMKAGDVPSVSRALQLAKPVIEHVREEAASAEAKYGHLAEDATEELIARAALLDHGADADALAATPLATDPSFPAGPVVEEAEEPTGAMVALFPDAKTAADLALPGGEKPSQLHCTLAFLGKAKSLDFDKAKAAVEVWAAKTPKLSGELSGVGHFDLGKEGVVTYRSLDLPGLPAPREGLVKALDAAGTPARQDHGFTPHMSVDYKMRRPKVEKQPISFDSVTLAWGGDRHHFPLAGK